jgi:cytochrome c
MDSFEINKILGALLGTCLFLLAVHIASGAIFTPPVPAKPGYEIAVKEEAGQQAAAKPAEQPIENLLASASVEHGAQVAKQCTICHNFQEGQGPKVGPDLYGVVGRPVASVPGFNYSAALKAMGGTWTFDALNKWLTDPRNDVPGTAMTFAGLQNEKQRADVIAYLNSLSKNPLPMPTAAANPTAAAPANPPATAAPTNPPAAAAPANPPATAAPTNPPAAAAPANPPATAAPANPPAAAAPANPSAAAAPAQPSAPSSAPKE